MARIKKVTWTQDTEGETFVAEKKRGSESISSEGISVYDVTVEYEGGVTWTWKGRIGNPPDWVIDALNWADPRLAKWNRRTCPAVALS